MAELPAEPQFSNFLDTIVVCVGKDGEENQDFTVHTSFATKSSRFFQAALGRDWKEAHEKRVPLPETTAADFAMYLQWLYSGRVVKLDYNQSYTSSATLIRLYILGDYLDDSRFCNDVIDTLVRNSSWTESHMVIDCATVDSAWDKTLPKSPLRKLLVDFIICDLGQKFHAPTIKKMGTWSAELSAEIFGTMRGAGLDAAAKWQCPIKNRDTCAYHRHGEEYPKCS